MAAAVAVVLDTRAQEKPEPPAQIATVRPVVQAGGGPPVAATLPNAVSLPLASSSSPCEAPTATASTGRRVEVAGALGEAVLAAGGNVPLALAVEGVPLTLDVGVPLTLTEGVPLTLVVDVLLTDGLGCNVLLTEGHDGGEPDQLPPVALVHR